VFPRLYAIVDGASAQRVQLTVPSLALAFLQGGARLLQIRMKEAPSGELLAAVEAAVRDGAGYDTAVIVNDRADVARLAGAAGVHVGQDDLQPSLVRRVVGPDAIVGLSTHDAAEVDAALDEPIGYLAVGPVFTTTTKQTGRDAVGLDLVRYAVAAVAERSLSLPVVAIGGITLDTAPHVIAAGASSVAVISDLIVGDPAARVREYLDRLR
jgi:thiamine-phosphate pyrophosphorylase